MKLHRAGLVCLSAISVLAAFVRSADGATLGRRKRLKNEQRLIRVKIVSHCENSRPPESYSLLHRYLNF